MKFELTPATIIYGKNIKLEVIGYLYMKNDLVASIEIADILLNIYNEKALSKKDKFTLSNARDILVLVLEYMMKNKKHVLFLQSNFFYADIPNSFITPEEVKVMLAKTKKVNCSWFNNSRNYNRICYEHIDNQDSDSFLMSCKLVHEALKSVFFEDIIDEKN